jgi:hypothetical protein
MNLSGDLPGNLGTDICEVLGLEFIPPRPTVTVMFDNAWGHRGLALLELGISDRRAACPFGNRPGTPRIAVASSSVGDLMDGGDISDWSGGDAEAANSLEQRLDLGAVGSDSRARQPELLEGVGRVFRILLAEGSGHARRLARPPG